MLLKLTTDRHEASRSLFLTAELLVSDDDATDCYLYSDILILSLAVVAEFQSYFGSVYVLFYMRRF